MLTLAATLMIIIIVAEDMLFSIFIDVAADIFVFLFFAIFADYAFRRFSMIDY